MLKIRQLKAQQDAEKKAQAESGAPAQPKQTPGQLRIQKGKPGVPKSSSRQLPSSRMCGTVSACPDVGDLNFDHTDTIEVDFPNPVRRRPVYPTRGPMPFLCGRLLPPLRTRDRAQGGKASVPSRVAECGVPRRMI